jgi:hypothetical protein
VNGVRPLPLPDGALLAVYRDQGAYTDCYAVDIGHAVTQAEFVRAFYTSRLFKLERFVLKWLVAKPSSDPDAAALATGERNAFAAWTVEGRTDDQLLMCDYQSRTRSWFMTAPIDRGGTRLYFGSAVVPNRPNGRPDRAFGWAFRWLLGFHKIYARGLLKAAAANL